jgi:hypothetical protein
MNQNSKEEKNEANQLIDKKCINPPLEVTHNEADKADNSVPICK